MIVSWTPTARISFLNILEYLEENWSLKEVEGFINEVEKVIELIKDNPFLFISSHKRKNIRMGFVTKHNCLYYRVKTRKKEIELLVFWDNRKDPINLYV